MRTSTHLVGRVTTSVEALPIVLQYTGQAWPIWEVSISTDRQNRKMTLQFSGSFLGMCCEKDAENFLIELAKNHPKQTDAWLLSSGAGRNDCYAIECWTRFGKVKSRRLEDDARLSYSKAELPPMEREDVDRKDFLDRVKGYCDAIFGSIIPPQDRMHDMHLLTLLVAEQAAKLQASLIEECQKELMDLLDDRTRLYNGKHCRSHEREREVADV